MCYVQLASSAECGMVTALQRERDLVKLSNLLDKMEESKVTLKILHALPFILEINHHMCGFRDRAQI